MFEVACLEGQVADAVVSEMVESRDQGRVAPHLARRDYGQMDNPIRSTAPIAGAMVVVTLVAFAVVLVAGLATARDTAAGAAEQARSASTAHARALQAGITERMAGKSPVALARLAALVNGSLLSDPTVAGVRIWRLQGAREQVIFSDDARLIGSSRPLAPAHGSVLRRGEVIARTATVDDGGHLTEVQTRIVTPAGTPLLLETSYHSEAAGVAEAARTFGVLLVSTLVVALVAQVLLAMALVRRLRAIDPSSA